MRILFISLLIIFPSSFIFAQSSDRTTSVSDTSTCNCSCIIDPYYQYIDIVPSMVRLLGQSFYFRITKVQDVILFYGQTEVIEEKVPANFSHRWSSGYSVITLFYPDRGLVFQFDNAHAKLKKHTLKKIIMLENSNCEVVGGIKIGSTYQDIKSFYLEQTQSIPEEPKAIAYSEMPLIKGTPIYKEDKYKGITYSRHYSDEKTPSQNGFILRFLGIETEDEEFVVKLIDIEHLYFVNEYELKRK